MSDLIVLDVGGKIFKTKKQTLLQAGYFANLFADLEVVELPLFLDRSGKAFEHVLQLLRDPNYPYPPVYYAELDFYQIDLYRDMVLLDFQGEHVIVSRKSIARLEKISAMVKDKRYLYLNKSAERFKRIIERKGQILAEDYDDFCSYKEKGGLWYAFLANNEWFVLQKETASKSPYLKEMMDTNIKVTCASPKEFQVVVDYLNGRNVPFKYVNTLEEIYKLEVPKERIQSFKLYKTGKHPDVYKQY